MNCRVELFNEEICLRRRYMVIRFEFCFRFRFTSHHVDRADCERLEMNL